MNYLTSTQAANLLNIKPQTLRRWRLDGRGPAYIRLSGTRGRVLYSEASITSWTTSRTFSSTSQESVAEAGR